MILQIYCHSHIQNIVKRKKIVIAQLKNLTFAYVVLYDYVISSMTQAAFTVDVFYPEAFFC